MAKVKQYLKNWAKKILPGNLPDFITIGAQKSGTSSLHYYLSQHPGLEASYPKEIHYFDRYVHYGYSLDWYKNHFITKSLKPKLYFETTPNYIYHEDVARQLSQLMPDIKLILILREPVDRAYSAWNMYYDFFKKGEVDKFKKGRHPGEENPIYKYFYRNRKSFPSFMEAIKIEEKLINNKQEKEPAIIRRGLYIDQILTYLKYFDPEQLLILGFKEFINDIPTALNKIFTFLEIKHIEKEKLKLASKNTRKYKKQMTNEERIYTERFYNESNSKLFDFLGYIPDW